jgi:hypothetical protein
MGRNCEKYLAKLEKHHLHGGYAKVEEFWKKFGCLGRLYKARCLIKRALLEGWIVIIYIMKFLCFYRIGQI